MINLFYEFVGLWKLAAKHAPADGVVPVFTPRQSLRESSLLVFSHSISL